jgi:hypothetical protein
MLQLRSVLFFVNAYQMSSYSSSKCMTLPYVGNLCKMRIDVDVGRIERAISEHRSNRGQLGPTLVGSNINMQPWLLETGLWKLYHNVYFHAVFKGGNIGEKTAADLFIIKLKTAQHESAVHAVSWNLLDYTSLPPGRYLGVSGGNLELRNEIRRPDFTLCPTLPAGDENPSMPRFLKFLSTNSRNHKPMPGAGAISH